MKNIFRNLLILCPLFMFSQNSSAQIKLEGKWTASCAMNRTDMSSMNFCDVCNVTFNKDSNSLVIKTATWNFTKDSLTFEIGDKKYTEHYTLDSSNNTLKFPFKKDEESFKIYELSEQLILLDKSNDIISLKKK